MTTAGRPHLLYLHGFASGPGSYKGRRYAAFFSERGYAVERLDLRLPDRDRLRVSAMVDRVVEVARERGRVVIIGSSLGGLVAAHAAARLDEVLGMVLMAPAFGLAERWVARLEPETLERWRGGAPLACDDHAGGPPLQLDYGFYEDARDLDAPPEPSVPTLVFHGENDEVVPLEASMAYARRSAQVGLVATRDGHPLVESLDRMLPEALDFIETLWRTKT